VAAVDVELESRIAHEPTAVRRCLSGHELARKKIAGTQKSRLTFSGISEKRRVCWIEIQFAPGADEAAGRFAFRGLSVLER
jgi:hypothetical protein